MNKSLRNLGLGDIAFLVAISVVILWVSYMTAAYLYVNDNVKVYQIII